MPGMCGMELNLSFVLFYMMICNFLGHLISKEEQEEAKCPTNVSLFHFACAGDVKAAESSLKTQTSRTVLCSWLSLKNIEKHKREA